MYIFKNAILSITRNKGRNILIGIIIMVIGAACAVTLSIRNSANTLVKAYEEKYNIESTISFNREALMKNFTPGEDNAESNIDAFNDIYSITTADVDKYGDSDYVDYYYYTYTLGMNGDDLTAATDSLQKTTTETTTTRNKYGQMGPGGMMGPSQSTTTKTKTENIINMRGTKGDFSVVGYSSYEGMTDFINGSYTISAGEVSSDFEGYNCVINEELATLNDLEVGDKITLVSTNDTDLTYELTVTGIFTDSSEDSSNVQSMFSNSANMIITNVNVVNKMVSDDSDAKATVSPTFVLKNKDVVDKFASEVESKGLDENYQVTNNLDEVESQTESITNVSSFATMFLLVTLGIGGVVLLVINMINVRERKYEIGVLRTIGMSKTKVIVQFVFEIFIIALFSLLIGAGIGATSSVKIANSLLSKEIAEAQEQQEEIRGNFGGMGRTQVATDESSTSEASTTDKKEDNALGYGVAKINEVNDINAVVDFKVLMELLGIGLGLTLFSSVSAMISIAKFSPLAILRERS